MSYLGREQHLCVNGHLFVRDSSPNDQWETPDTSCPHCQAASVFSNDIEGMEMNEEMSKQFSKYVEESLGSFLQEILQRWPQINRQDALAEIVFISTQEHRKNR